MAGRRINRERSAMKSIWLLCIAAVAVTSIRTGRAEERIFPLEEVSVFDLPENTGQMFLLGQRAICGDKPDPNVAKYPAFASSRPIYGTVDFSAPLGEKRNDRVYRFAFDSSGGTDTPYDRFYFDLNHDRNLTNDQPVMVRKDPPRGAMLAYAEIKQQTCFENLAIPFPCGAEGERPLEMMPRLIISNNGFAMLSLVTTKARKGQIDLGGKTCNVLLGHCYIASGWFDKPWTALHLTPAGSSRPFAWSGSDRLNAMHKVSDTFYTFSATPTGDKLIVRPYEGPLGTFSIGPGGRNVDRLEIMGSLQSKTTEVAIGEHSDNNRSEYTRSCRLPVGDYMPEYTNVQYGTLAISLSNNYHSDGKPRDTTNRRWVYGIAIREDKPFVFDFSNKPVVLFASPARDHRVKVGEEISVMAVLIDPVLDVMIRRLSIGSGVGTSLDPKVTIARANGEIVAEGVMPFG